MLNLTLLILLLILAVRAFFALRGASAIRREFGQSRVLDGLVLLCPLGPLAMLAGPGIFPPVIVFVVVAVLYAGVYVVASRQRAVLETSGTDRVNSALTAISAASLAALVGAIYVVLASIFAFAVPSLGA